MRCFTLGRNKRLLSNKAFEAVFARGRRFSNELLVLYVAKNQCGWSRLGVSVGKSVGKAVVRNRVKRLLREAFRQSQQEIPAGFDYVLMLSPTRPKNSKLSKDALTFEQIKSSFLFLLSKAKKKIRQ